MRQKIVPAVTSGVVPDLFQNTPVEIIALYAWEDQLVGVAIGDSKDRTRSREERHGAPCGVVDADPRGRGRIVLIIAAGPVELPMAQYGAAC
jgi:hypothetical protein